MLSVEFSRIASEAPTAKWRAVTPVRLDGLPSRYARHVCQVMLVTNTTYVTVKNVVELTMRLKIQLCCTVIIMSVRFDVESDNSSE